MSKLKLAVMEKLNKDGVDVVSCEVVKLNEARQVASVKINGKWSLFIQYDENNVYYNKRDLNKLKQALA